jgi:transposase
MLHISSQNRYFIYQGVTDMRKQFDGLGGLVRQHFTSDLLSGDVFIFINRRKDRIKLLQWDRNGFALYYKRLEKGTFSLPKNGDDEPSSELSWPELILLLEGIEVKEMRHKKRYKKAG